MLRAALIDLDGTLVDSAPDIAAALNQVRGTFGQGALSVPEVTRLIGKGARHLVRGSLSMDFSEDEVTARLEPALAGFLAHYERVNGQASTVFPGVFAGLRDLKAAGLRCACVTNKPTAATRQLLAATGLAVAFDAVVGGDDVPRLKPDPMPLAHAAERLAVAPGEVVFIGDSENDLLAARAFGCPCVLLSYGYHDAAALPLPADAIVDSLVEAAAWIASLAAPQPDLP